MSEKPFSFINSKGQEFLAATGFELSCIVGKALPQHRKDMEDGIDYTNWEDGKYSSPEEFRKQYSYSDSFLRPHHRGKPKDSSVTK